MDFSLLRRSYDLRAIYPTEIDEDFFFRLGVAFIRYTGLTRIAVGHDARLSGASLARALMEGIATAGGYVIDVGLVSTDMLGFATCRYDDIDAGFMVTASHNPKEYNGVKCLDHSGKPYNLKEHGTKLAAAMTHMPPVEAHSLTEKNSELRDIRDDFAEHVLSFLLERDFSALKVVVDAGNGAAGAFIETLQEKTRFELIPLFLEPDGNFPNHHPNPIIAKNREDARVKLLETHADIAFIFDGDADRIMLLDELGEVVSSGIIASIIAKQLLHVHPGSGFVGNAVVSHIFHDTVQEGGGTYYREKVGHVYIRERMQKDSHIVFAGEHSAHYFFRDNSWIDSGILVGMMILDMMYQEKKKLSDLTRAYRQYITLEETNFTVLDPQAVIAQLREDFSHETQDELDGLTVTYADGAWWNVRPSSNEPLLRLNLEAKTQERFDQLYARVLASLTPFLKK